jgi:hypothetical protein
MTLVIRTNLRRFGLFHVGLFYSIFVFFVLLVPAG